MRRNMRLPHQPIDWTHRKKPRIRTREPLEFNRMVKPMMAAVITKSKILDWRVE
jgi:hypothetical protein